MVGEVTIAAAVPQVQDQAVVTRNHTIRHEQQGRVGSVSRFANRIPIGRAA